MINFIVSSFSTPSKGAAINAIYDTAVDDIYNQRETHRNGVICFFLRLAKKDEELRVLREELKEKTARW